MSAKNTPKNTDGILGGQTPSPNIDAVLGGIEGIYQALKSEDLTVQLDALDKAWQLGEAGHECLQSALSDRSKVVRRRARWLLRQPDSSTGLIPSPPPQWNLRERFLSNGNSNRIGQFYHRELREFQPKQPIADPQQFAIGVRCLEEINFAANDGDELDEADVIGWFSHYLDRLPQMADEDQLESLVIGVWGDPIDTCTGDVSSQNVVEILAKKSDRLPKLNSVFIGELTFEECEISWLIQSDLSPLLKAYPKLELLQARGGNGLEFKASDDDARHDHLKALIVETGGLSRKTLQQIYDWDFPALEHLELWFGSPEYGGNCWDQDLAPLLEELIFPNLTYLGIRNCPFIDDAMDRIVRSPLITGLQVLDLSLGTLTDDGAAKLLACPAIQDLQILNVAESYLSGAMTDQLMSLGIEVIVNEQRVGEPWDDGEVQRYCVVSE